MHISGPQMRLLLGLHQLTALEREFLFGHGHLAGGDLTLEWNGEGPVLMTGPAQEVYSGVIEVAD